MHMHARMTIGVTGSSGLVGSALVAHLTAQGHRVVPMRRQNGPPNFDVFPTDAIVHLAGEPIAAHRWNRVQRKRIRDSRVDGTRTLCETISRLDPPPRVLLCASAIGYYGDRGDELLDETAGPGHGFLPEVVQAWEDATQIAARRCIRVVLLRFGMILSRNGGALPPMARPFQFGLGGRIGSGRQYWSWIAMADVLGAIDHLLYRDDLAGPMNLVSPHPATNQEFTTAIGSILHRPAWLAMPSWAVRGVFGSMGKELLLASAKVFPRRLLESGYTFRCVQLDDALRSVLDCGGS